VDTTCLVLKRLSHSGEIYVAVEGRRPGDGLLDLLVARMGGYRRVSARPEAVAK
jgi:hypothetical protein